MRKKVSSFPRDTLEQASVVRDGWDKVGKRLHVPNLTLQKFLSKMEEARARVEHAEQLKLAKARAIYERNVCLSELWDLTKRVRNAAKATFGDYSPELALLLHPHQDDNGGNGQA